MAKIKRAKIGIGLLNETNDIKKYLEKLKPFVDISIVGTEIDGFKSYPTKTPEEAGLKLLDLIEQNKIDGACKGQLHPRMIYKPLFERRNDRLAYFAGSKNIIPAISQHNKTKRFVAWGSGDLPQGYDLSQKKREAMMIAEYIRGLKIEPYVAVMAMRRAKPKNAEKRPLGYRPIPIVEKTFHYAELTLKHLKKHKIRADFFNIEYETALSAGANIIIPPIGAVGNAILRTLNFLTDEWDIVSAPNLSLKPIVFEDSFKTGTPKNYYNSIISAAAHANSIKINRSKNK